MQRLYKKLCLQTQPINNPHLSSDGHTEILHGTFMTLALLDMTCANSHP